VIGVASVPPVAADPPTTGTITGRIVLTGSDNKPIATIERVYAYVEGVSDPPGTKRREVVIAQINQRYVPDLRVVPVGTTIRFPNQDNYEHNVFSPSVFDLKRYSKGAGRTQTFDEDKEYDIYCDIHPTMVALVKVMPSSLYTEVAADGTFTIRNVPPGKHKIVAWTPHSKERSRRDQVVVAGGTTDIGKLGLMRESKPQGQHLRKDGTRYRYTRRP
jgi:plastocyanin